jgi:hypothetical protein
MLHYSLLKVFSLSLPNPKLYLLSGFYSPAPVIALVTTSDRPVVPSCSLLPACRPEGP